MTLTTAAKLKQPKRVPSHFIDFDFIVLFSVFLPSWMALEDANTCGEWLRQPYFLLFYCKRAE